MRFLRIVLIPAVLFLLLSSIAPTYGNSEFFPLENQNPSQLPYLFSPQSLYHPAHIHKRPGHYSLKDWRLAIDSCWGPGLPTNVKLQIFDQFWGTLDSNYACFNNITVNWDSLRQVYRDEISRSVSRGRFSAIMNYLAMALQDIHTVAIDTLVSLYTSPDPGVPLLAISGWINTRHFGAGLTPLPDSSLLVYRVVPNHPLGLERGDVVLGYDRIPWKILYKELLAAQLPWLAFGCWGSSDSSFTHACLMGAGMNWHLFDTIDVVKYSTGDTLHFPTSLLASCTTSLFCTEQMDIPGVPMPNWGDTQSVSYGIVSGTQVGYIYGWLWQFNAEHEFYKALDTLINIPTLKGMVVDFRFNAGGGIPFSDSGLQLIFRDSVYTIGFAIRSDPSNHYAMQTRYPPNLYIIPDNGVSWYNKPIAVLTGPGALSAGDQVALRMKFHPRVRTFGKSTNTAFSGPRWLDLHPQWWAHYAFADAYLVSDTTHYLTHTYQSVDVPVWLTQADVAQGYDTVVRAALAWIDSVAQGVNEPPGPERSVEQATLRTYPNPITSRATIELTLACPTNISIKVYNVAGQEVATLANLHSDAGRQTFYWDAKKATNGVYFCRVAAGHKTRVVKLFVLK